MKTAIHEWPEYINEIFRVTANGGHIQLTESLGFSSNSGTLANDSAIRVIERTRQKYALIMQYDLEVGPKLVEMVRDAGYRGVEEKAFEIPVGNWHADPEMNKAGVLMLEHMIEEIEGWARKAMTEIGIPEDGVDMYIEKARRELRDPRHQLSMKVYALKIALLIGRYYVTARKGSRSSPRGSVSPKAQSSPPPSPK